MTEIRTTVVVAPREQFGWTRPALEGIFPHTEVPYNLVYVDGGSPAPVRRYLTLRARQRGFRLLRTEHHLSPMEARALALPHVDTEYVCFIDNDVLVTPGWLARLVRCADETEAWAVGPLYCNEIRRSGASTWREGQAHVVEEDGRRSFFEEHRFPALHQRGAVPPATRADRARRVPLQALRTELFDKFGLQDPRYLSSGENLDLCLQLREAGYPVYIEPAAVVANQPPPPFRWSDLPFYLLRWSDAWNRISLRCFREHWDIPADDWWIGHHYGWLTRHRGLARMGRGAPGWAGAAARWRASWSGDAPRVTRQDLERPARASRIRADGGGCQSS
jgi:hypothetical protein